MPRSGLLVKRGRRFKTWRTRWVVVSGRTLKYYLSEGGQQRGEMSLTEGYVIDEPTETFGRTNVAAIITPSRTLYIQAATSRELDRWRYEITLALTGRGRLSSPSASPTQPAPPMPEGLDIDGVVETGAELRVRASGSLLDALCVAWFKVSPGGELPDLKGDPSKCESVSMIPGATIHTYTVKASDVGCRIGCSAHPATAHTFVNVIAPLPVVAVDPSEVAARVSLRPHRHHKFCDRRVRVCTAEGRYREGEVLRVATRGDESLAGYRLVWARSEPVVSAEGHTLLPGVQVSTKSRTSSSAAAAAASSAAEPDGGDERTRALAQALSQRIVRLTPAQLEALEFTPTLPSPLHHMPVTPAAHEAAPSPLASLSPPKRGPAASAPGPPRGAPLFPLSLDDVGRMVRAELHPIVAGSAPVIVSNAVGPVEAAPPRARVIWVEGAPVVGGLLLGRWLYFGGVQGGSRVSWIRVAADGSSSVVKGPLEVKPSQMPPALGFPPSAADAHPCAYRLGAVDNECVIKFRVQPVRADGDKGHAEAARLRAKVTSPAQDGAAPPDADMVADASREAIEAAPTVQAARAWGPGGLPAAAEDEAPPAPWPGGVHLGAADWVATSLAVAGEEP
ncbi:hypothetical protein FNF31_03708 [Cafeteria roenbergensis]|uniref:PH domain-containing protein n=1 Tax=Cafeteria roenbergensis TaxID=33653 RepID=A0A5A8DAJ9_CAFRO|nr:hypothetical protein FNF28_05409 [Cafeteria roenbergensis]KAA0161594.1 hypothetical protein FNF31_03708 [Cafeteria roenbergensis]